MVKIKSEQEIKIMAEAGKILAGIIKKLEKEVRPGKTTKELDRAAEALILNSGGKCSFKGYQGFPACLCTSVNEEIVHALPGNRVLKEGDIISLDLGIHYKGYHADMAITLPVGKVQPEALRLIRTAKKALKRGIKKARPGNTIGDLGNTIQRHTEDQGFNVIRELCGHGIGRNIHEDPQILNYGKRKTGLELKEGMVLCLEPMISAGDWQIQKSKDGYGFETIDKSLSAHFEHTIVIVKDGCLVLTK